MTTILAFLGAVLSIIGLYLVHHSNKTYPLWRRLSYVTVTVVGVFLLWYSLATGSPGISDVRIKVVGVNKETVAAEFQADNYRNCSIEKIESEIITEDNQSFKLESEFLFISRMDIKEVGVLLVKNPKQYKIKNMTFKFKHFCPFGFEANTKLEKLDVPHVPEPSSEPITGSVPVPSSSIPPSLKAI